MQCGLCGYEWCWSCGFHSKSYFHKFTGEMFCQSWNTLFSEIKMHILLKIIIALILLIIAPVALLIFMVIGGMTLVFMVILESCNIVRRSTFFCIFYCILNTLICIPIGGCLGLIAYAIIIVPITLFTIFFILNGIYRWCISTKKINIT